MDGCAISTTVMQMGSDSSRKYVRLNLSSYNYSIPSSEFLMLGTCFEKKHILYWAIKTNVSDTMTSSQKLSAKQPYI